MIRLGRGQWSTSSFYDDRDRYTASSPVDKVADDLVYQDDDQLSFVNAVKYAFNTFRRQTLTPKYADARFIWQSYNLCINIYTLHGTVVVIDKHVWLKQQMKWDVVVSYTNKWQATEDNNNKLTLSWYNNNCLSSDETSNKLALLI